VPEIVLYVDRSPESEDAYELLTKAKLPFRTQSSSSFDVPAAEFGDTVYKGLAAVQKLVRGLASGPTADSFAEGSA
jgi:hypothetical protein